MVVFFLCLGVHNHMLRGNAVRELLGRGSLAKLEPELVEAAGF